MEVNLVYALFYLLTPLLYFEVIIALLTMPLFWILLVMTILGLVVGQKLDDT